MSNELFVELNDEQQEIVTGGVAGLLSISGTSFEQQFVYGHTGSSSGPNGSVAGSYGISQNTKTYGFGLLGAYAA